MQKENEFEKILPVSFLTLVFDFLSLKTEKTTVSSIKCTIYTEAQRYSTRPRWRRDRMVRGL